MAHHQPGRAAVESSDGLDTETNSHAMSMPPPPRRNEPVTGEKRPRSNNDDVEPSREAKAQRPSTTSNPASNYPTPSPPRNTASHSVASSPSHAVTQASPGSQAWCWQLYTTGMHLGAWLASGVSPSEITQLYSYAALSTRLIQQHLHAYNFSPASWVRSQSRSFEKVRVYDIVEYQDIKRDRAKDSDAITEHQSFGPFGKAYAGKHRGIFVGSTGIDQREWAACSLATATQSTSLGE